MRAVLQYSEITFKKDNRSFPRVEIHADVVVADMNVIGADTAAIRAGLVSAVNDALKVMEKESENKQ